MTLFYVPDIMVSAQLPAEESLHCIKVLRMQKGDKIILTDGKGFFYSAIITEPNPKHCQFEIIEKKTGVLPWQNNIHIAFAPAKNADRNEWFIEKATETGINNISFIHCRYSERKQIKTDRITKILVSAMKQSGKAVLPEINEMIAFSEFIKMDFNGQKFIAHCYPGEKPLLSHAYNKNEDVLILIGPEGDFSEEEVQLATKYGFIPVSLGESRLRTETAALLACQTIHIVNQL